MFSPENLVFAHKIKLFQNMKLLKKELGTQTKKKMPAEFRRVSTLDAKKDKKDSLIPRKERRHMKRFAWQSTITRFQIL